MFDPADGHVTRHMAQHYGVAWGDILTLLDHMRMDRQGQPAARGRMDQLIDAGERLEAQLGEDRVQIIRRRLGQVADRRWGPSRLLRR